MAQISVTSDSISGVANQLSSGAQSIESQLQNLKSLVDGLVGGEWSGDASLSFQELYSQWDQAGIQLKDALEGVSGILSQAALTYEENEQGVAGTFRA